MYLTGKDEEDMSKQQTHLKLITVLISAALILSGCSVSRFVDNMTMSDEQFNNVVGIGGGTRDLDSEIEREKDAYGVEAEAAKEYYDEKTGVVISETQYYAYNITDSFKKYGLYIAVFFFAVGFLMRRLIKNSASLRKLGMVFEICIPLVYILLAYVLSAIADKL